MPETIIKTINTLQHEIENDSFNLTREDHDAIYSKIDELKRFIEKRYEQHKHII